MKERQCLSHPILMRTYQHFDIDINMPVLNGYETIKLITEHHPSLPVMALTMYLADYSMLQMLRLGARGFVAKNCGKELLLEALETLCNGDFYIPPQLSRMLIAGNASEVAGLTEREVEFLSYVHLDLTYKAIAEKMLVSERTVHGYRNNLFFKLDLKSRSGLVDYAFKTGIIGIVE
jgi:DNA-binding NarL/FixJ family response regulator